MRVIRNIAAADQAAAAAMRPRLEELKRKTGRAAEAAFRECIEARDAEPAPPDERGPARRPMTGARTGARRLGACRRGASSLARRRRWRLSSRRGRVATLSRHPDQPTQANRHSGDSPTRRRAPRLSAEKSRFSAVAGKSQFIPASPSVWRL